MERITLIKKNLIVFSLISALLLSSCSAEEQGFSDVSVEIIQEGEIPSDLSTADTGEIDFNFSDRDREGNFDKNVLQAMDNGETLDITKEGTYIFSGEITDKVITVSAGDKDKVQIVLDGATIRNSQGPAIHIKSADKVFITTAEGSENRIVDGLDYTYTDDNGDVDGAIFSRTDLTINGKGKLILEGNNKHGIVSKDDLKILNLTLDVTAKNVALNGKDCVKISGASITANAGSDGIRSDNADDANKGFVYIESGKILLNAGNDGIQSEKIIKITTAELEITTGNGSSSSLSSSTESFKGIKSSSDIAISGGNFKINAKDDCIHSNNTITISDGTFELSSGDDGIHADADLSISGGNIKIAKSYEGLESSRIFITGGNISVKASDDGMNAAGGNDGSSMGGRPGMGGFSNSVGEITIAGGFLLVDASGDGIDSNGTFAMTGGIVLVSGPENNGNGALDYDRGAAVTGGVLVALGSSGMATGFTQAENQGAVLYSFTTQQGGTSFALSDSAGNIIVSFTPNKSYSSAVVTAPELSANNTSNFIVGGTVANTDENGFARNSTLTGGTGVAEFTIPETLIYKVGGGMNPGGGFRPGGGDHGGGMMPGGGMRPNKPW